MHDLCGSDPAANIPALELALARTKFSKVKRDLIVAAFEAEAEARQSDTPAVSRLIKLLVRAGESRANARELAVDFKPELRPFQFLFVKRQSFIKAEFAKVYDGGSFRDADRPMAIATRQLLERRISSTGSRPYARPHGTISSNRPRPRKPRLRD